MNRYYFFMFTKNNIKNLKRETKTAKLLLKHLLIFPSISQCIKLISYFKT